MGCYKQRLYFIGIVYLNPSQVALTLSTLGNVMKGKQSIELLKRALEIKKQVYGEDHPNIARTLLCLSESYHDLGDIHQAKKMAQDAILLLQSTHDPPRKWHENKATVYMQDLLKGTLDLFPTSCPAFHLLQ